MDSGKEVVTVGENVTTTNGLNGTHDDAGEMKTRSKSGDEEPAKLKLRNARTAALQKNAADDKSGSNVETESKKEKMSLRSATDAEDAKSPVKEGGANARNATQDKANGSGGMNASAGVGGRKAKNVDDEKAPLSTAAAAAAAKKSDDDSGINSRASSVSNEDVIGLRTRTRSAKSQEAPSTSTPATKRGPGRPALTHKSAGGAAAAALFDDEVASNSLKRKAVVYLEEMEETEENDDEEGEGEGEPSVKRPSIGGAVVGVICSPWRAIRGKLSRPKAASRPDADADADADQTSNGVDAKENGDENGESESRRQEDAAADDQLDVERTADAANVMSRTCSLM